MFFSKAQCNPEYQYVRDVFSQFDHWKFPNELHNPHKTVVQKIYSIKLQNRFCSIDISSYYIASTMQWLYVTNQLKINSITNSPSEGYPDLLAKGLLSELNINSDPNIAPSKQVWGYVFDDTNKEKTILLAARVIGKKHYIKNLIKTMPF